MTNSVDPGQLASSEADLDLHCLKRQGISRFSRTRVNERLCAMKHHSHELNFVSSGSQNPKTS